MFNKIRKSILALAMVTVAVTAGQASAETLINGAGATFPYPLYSKWFSEYAKIDPSVKFNYQSIGSGGGIKQITAQTVDFGASDKFLTDEELKAAPGKLLHIPTVMGAVVVTYNLPGVAKGLKLTSEDVADIFLGKITKWNDPKIADDNPGVKLPDQPIIVVHRSDGSGTTSIFTDYLSSVSAEWKSKVGMGASVKWPVGLGGKGNEGVAGQVKTTQYTIGYVELAYAFENKLPYAFLKNKAATSSSRPSRPPAPRRPGQPRTCRPTTGSPWSTSRARMPTRSSASPGSWCIEQQKDPVKGKKLVEFLNWS